MRKEITTLILVFLVILTLCSLLSYNPADPSIHHSMKTEGVEVHNLFGLFGAHLAGFIIGLFGIGSFWIPLLLVQFTLRYWRALKWENPSHTFFGATLLVLSSGTLLSFGKETYPLFGIGFSAGGLVGIPLKRILLVGLNFTGGVTLLLLFLIVGLMLATGVSLTDSMGALKRCGMLLWALCVRSGFSLFKTLRGGFGRVQGISSTIRKGAALPLKQIPVKTPSPVKIAGKEPPPVKVAGKEPPSVKVAGKEPPSVKIAPKEPTPEAPRAAKIPIRKPVESSKTEFEPVSLGKKGDGGLFTLPSLDLLTVPEQRPSSIDSEKLLSQSGLLEKKLADFGIKGEVVEISPGPVITTFEYRPAPGVKISKIVNLSDDLALALKAISIRIVAPIPGKDVVGIEIPNMDREMVRFSEIVTSKEFSGASSSLTVCLGKDIVGNPVSVPMNKMPHLLVAGATGAGKSVGLNVMIASLLYKATPDDVRLLMVDPKRIELSVYDGIPHLISPVVTDMKKATNALFWAVREMERRYQLLADTACRNIDQYNELVAKGGKKKDAKEDDEPLSKLPFIVIIIDEFADLMMVASRDVEVALTRLAQMARAAGIHIVLATQRPSVDVLTGVIKANFPTRISFQVSSRIDSRTIIDSNGAENLLGNGDMLYLPPGTAKLARIHGAYISDNELSRVLEFLREQGTPEYVEEVTLAAEKEKGGVDKEDYDEKYDEAVALVIKTRQASISSVQRHLRIGYNRAARIIEVMEQEGLVGPSDGAKPREILVKDYEEIPLE